MSKFDTEKIKFVHTNIQDKDLDKKALFNIKDKSEQTGILQLAHNKEASDSIDGYKRDELIKELFDIIDPHFGYQKLLQVHKYYYLNNAYFNLINQNDSQNLNVGFNNINSTTIKN